MCQDFQHLPEPCDMYDDLIKEVKPNERLEEHSKSWYSLRDVVGLEIIDDDEMEEDEEDKEVTCIIKEGKETKRKLITAVRKVTGGHKMLAEAHKNIAEGWEMFEAAVGDARPGDLLQLLRSLKGMTTPMPPPMPMDVTEAGSPGTFIKPIPIQFPSPVKKEPQDKGDDPVMIAVDGKRKWACLQCDIIKGSKNGCDAHIRQAHTGKALICALCSHSSYNVDCMHRHKKEHN